MSSGIPLQSQVLGPKPILKLCSISQGVVPRPNEQWSKTLRDSSAKSGFGPQAGSYNYVASHQSGLGSPTVLGLMSSGVTETIRDPPAKSGFGPQAGSYNYVAVRPWVPSPQAETWVPYRSYN
ncbi:hypothetical protein TNCV_3057611 [Trichonephila clavipes]|nr:hypothetical protein TNCV_3057611 [Trichonephila clavipes]